MIAAQYGFDARHQFLGIKRFHNVIVCAEFQAEDFVKNFSFGGKHNNRDIGFSADFPADLIAVDSGQHQIQKDQIRHILFKGSQSFFSVIDGSGVKAFFGQIQGNQFCDIQIIVND